MKKFLFPLALFLCLSFCSPTSAQTLHTILFADTNDGEGFKVSCDRYSMFLTSVETAIGDSFNIADPIVMTEYACNKRSLLNILDSLTCEKNDIVVFIYVGHGARSFEDTSCFPQMSFAKPKGSVFHNPDDAYPLENVRDLIMRKNPRFCLVIGDCCNVYDQALSRKPSVMSPNFKDTISPQGEKIIRNLFLSQAGSIILTAAEPGKHAYYFRSCLNFIEK